jgi:hypothetical protein
MNIIRNRALWVSLAAFVSYCALILSVERQLALEIVRITQATMGLVALVALSRALWFSLTEPHPDKADVLTVCVSLMQFSFCVGGVWLTIWRLGDNSIHHWMLDTYFFGFVSGWLPALSSLLLVMVPGVLRRDEGTGEDVPPFMLILVGAVAGLGLFASLMILTLQPDAAILVESLKPWVK